MSKVMITVPCYENIYPDTMKCIWDLAGRLLDMHSDYWEYDLDFNYVRGYTVDKARNLCVHEAKLAEATHVLFVDNDMTFKPEYLEMMLEHDLPVVMGYYDHRPQDPEDKVLRTNLCKLGQLNYMEQVTPEEIREARDEGYDLIQVKGGGLGFALIKMEVFDSFVYPYFLWVNYNNGHCLSEDLYFAEQCERAGIDIFADTRCYCGHIFREVHGGGFDD